MGIGETFNRLLFNLTYNEKAEKAYDEQRKTSETAIQQLQGMVTNYRKQRSILITEGKASDYYSFQTAKFCTEWENWLQKNANLPEGDYASKKTEITTIWEILKNINGIAFEMSRIEPFLNFFLTDKQDKLTTRKETN
jgi:hypothetical protein